LDYYVVSLVGMGRKRIQKYPKMYRQPWSWKCLLTMILFPNTAFTSPLNLHGNCIVLFCFVLIFLIKLLAPVHAVSSIYKTRIFWSVFCARERDE
jgi:hypothetical protein